MNEFETLQSENNQLKAQCALLLLLLSGNRPPLTTNEKFGLRLKQIRQKMNLKQWQVAEKLKMSNQTYSRYESGARKPTLDFILAFADEFNVSVDWLLGRTDEIRR